MALIRIVVMVSQLTTLSQSRPLRDPTRTSLVIPRIGTGDRRDRHPSKKVELRLSCQDQRWTPLVQLNRDDGAH